MIIKAVLRPWKAWEHDFLFGFMIYSPGLYVTKCVAAIVLYVIK